jgi:plasmid stabilization system protein ParE
MKVEYTKQALADLRKISADSREFGESITVALESRIRTVVAHLAEHPEAAAPIAERPGMRVVPLIRHPYKIFYRALEDRVRILHIRHTARRPWTKTR